MTTEIDINQPTDDVLVSDLPSYIRANKVILQELLSTNATSTSTQTITLDNPDILVDGTVSIVFLQSPYDVSINTINFDTSSLVILFALNDGITILDNIGNIKLQGDTNNPEFPMEQGDVLVLLCKDGGNATEIHRELNQYAPLGDDGRIRTIQKLLVSGHNVADHIEDVTIHFTIDDSDTTSLDIVWSASKLENKFNNIDGSQIIPDSIPPSALDSIDIPDADRDGFVPVYNHVVNQFEWEDVEGVVGADTYRVKWNESDTNQFLDEKLPIIEFPIPEFDGHYYTVDAYGIGYWSPGLPKLEDIGPRELIRTNDDGSGFMPGAVLDDISSHTNQLLQVADSPSFPSGKDQGRIIPGAIFPTLSEISDKVRGDSLVINKDKTGFTIRSIAYDTIPVYIWIDPTNGNDSDSGTESDRPVKTFAKARDIGVALTGHAGRELYFYIADGIHTNSDAFRNVSFGSAKVTIKGVSLNSTRLTVSNGFKFLPFTDVHMEDFTVTGNGGASTYGLHLEGARAYVHGVGFNNFSTGIQVANGSQMLTGFKNVFIDNNNYGIYCYNNSHANLGGIPFSSITAKNPSQGQGINCQYNSSVHAHYAYISRFLYGVSVVHHSWVDVSYGKFFNCPHNGSIPLTLSSETSPTKRAFNSYIMAHDTDIEYS
jgi:hypothetical protein